eukprot:m.95169 g.95169  ORF g.95169 m.95169 type:complete len:53 (-) comp16588_c0_seq3:1071-1229(-)
MVGCGGHARANAWFQNSIHVAHLLLGLHPTPRVPLLQGTEWRVECHENEIQF